MSTVAKPTAKKTAPTSTSTPSADFPRQGRRQRLWLESCLVPRECTRDVPSPCRKTARRSLMREEFTDPTGRIDRRGFLGTGAGALAAAATLGPGRPAAAQATTKSTQAAELPKRTLGRTGVEVTILNLGTWLSPGGERLLRFAWANGIRYFDTAKSYGSEPMIGRWLKA